MFSSLFLVICAAAQAETPISSVEDFNQSRFEADRWRVGVQVGALLGNAGGANAEGASAATEVELDYRAWENGGLDIGVSLGGMSLADSGTGYNISQAVFGYWRQSSPNHHETVTEERLQAGYASIQYGVMGNGSLDELASGQGLTALASWSISVAPNYIGSAGDYSRWLPILRFTLAAQLLYVPVKDKLGNDWMINGVKVKATALSGVVIRFGPLWTF